MSDEHPDVRVLLHVAFPERYAAVEERWLMHVLTCPQCMEDILHMREMEHITSALSQEDESKESAPYAPRSPFVYDGGGAAAPVASAAFNGDSGEAANYLDQDGDMEWPGFFDESGDEPPDTYDGADTDME